METELLLDNYPIVEARLPPGWRLMALGQALTDARNGYSSGSHNESGLGIAHLRPMNIDRGGELNFDQIKYVPIETSELRVSKDDIAFNNTNSREHVGKTAVFTLTEKWGFSNHITRLRLSAEFLPEFVAFQLQYLWQAGYFRFHAKQHVNQASISLNTLTKRVPLLVAPINDQERIVRQLDKTWTTLDLVRNTVGRANDQLSRYENQTILDAAEGRLVVSEKDLAQEQGREYTSGVQLLKRITNERLSLSGSMSAARPAATYSRITAEERGNVPTPPGWAYARIDEVGEVTLGKKREPSTHTGPHMRPYLRVANVQENRIDISDVLQMNFPEEEYQIYRLQHSDLLLNEGQSPELVGRPAMYRDEIPGACFQMTLLRFRAYNGVSPTYALLVFRAFLREGKFREAARWTTNIAHLSTRRFAAMTFPLPPLEEQERIVEEAERRLAVISEVAETFANIANRVQSARFATLTNAFFGYVSQADIEPSDDDINDTLQQQQFSDKGDVQVRRGAPRSQAQRKVLVDVLTDARRDLTPRELFDEAGYTDPLVDEFYAELREAVANGQITEVRDSAGEPILTLLDAKS